MADDGRLSRRGFLTATAAVAAGMGIGCSDDGTSSGGANALGGAPGAGTGGATTAGDSSAQQSSGGRSSGGASSPTGGSNSGGLGTESSGGHGIGGGSPSGGATASGGANSGGVGIGGAQPSGGTAAGGSSSGGMATGGGETGGASNAGASGSIGSGGSSGSAGSAGSTGVESSGGSIQQGGNGGQAGSTSTGTSLVGIASSASSVGQAVRDAIALTSGLSFISAGDTVLLKPNLNSGDPSPFSTNPEIVAAMIELARDHGATRVIVADRSNPAVDTMVAMQNSGILAVVNQYDAEAINLNDMETIRVTPPGAANWNNGFETYRMLLDDVDHIINLACCKHHSLANFTMTLKAWMGIIVQNDRMTAHNNLGDRLPELHLAVRESFTILDATNACLTNGPNPGGETSSPGLVVATADPAACDVTGLAILKYELARLGINNTQLSPGVWEQPQIQRAMAIGLGITERSQYQATANGVDIFEELMSIINA